MKLNLSYNKKRLKRLPKIQRSNINLSINNTYVVKKNETPDNYSYIQKDILPNIFAYNQKTKEKKLSPIKKIKEKGKITPNINTFNNFKTNTVKSEAKSTNDFELTTKLLNQLLWFFNIRELLILKNINKKINKFIKNTQIFKKFISLNDDLKSGNLFKDLNDNQKIINLKNSILKKSNNNIKIEINTESSNYHFNNNRNNNDHSNINALIKYNLFNKKHIKFKKILNPDILRLSQISLKTNNNVNETSMKKLDKDSSNIQIKRSQINSFKTNLIDSFNNSANSSNTMSSKTDKDIISKNESNYKINNESLNLDKLISKILSLIKNKGNKIILLMKKYKLSSIEARMILYGIFEFILLKKQKLEKEKNSNFFSSLVISNLKADKYFNFYLEPILNLEYDDITKIQFDNIIISSMKIMKNICNLLWRNFTSIKVLILPNNNIEDNCSKILFQTLKYNKSLVILNLSHNKISNNSIIYSDLFFKNNKSLNTLVLSYNYLGSIGSNNLLNYLKCNENSCIRTLDISYNGITEKGIESLVQYVKSNEKLLYLFYSGNCIYDKGLDIFEKALLSNEKNAINNIKLSYLDISNNFLTENSLKHINTMLSLLSFIKSINLGYNDLSNQGVYNIFSFINNKSRLVSLDLSQTNINEKAIEFISEKVDKSIILRILNLSNNNLSQACIYLKKLLIKETNIKVIKLVSCNMSENINLLFQGLCKNGNIETFDISNNRFNNKNTILSNDILDFFKENKKIINLILDNVNINDLTMSYIVKGIELNCTIKKLSLKDNYITNEHIDKLTNSIEKNEIIRKIELEGNGLSQIYKQKIYAILSEKLSRNKLPKK